jgi:hypothetical protein
MVASSRYASGNSCYYAPVSDDNTARMALCANVGADVDPTRTDVACPSSIRVKVQQFVSAGPNSTDVCIVDEEPAGSG